jgi:hypothetical protein
MVVRMKILLNYCGEELDMLIFRETGAYQLPEMIKIPESIDRVLGCPNCKEPISRRYLTR